jgi:DNA primase
LFAWESVRGFPRVILVEGLFDLAVLWQAGFLNTTCGVGTHLSPAQFAQLCDRRDREVLLVFDADSNQAGQQAARRLAQRLAAAGLIVRIAELSDGHDPNSYFAAGATAADFTSCLEHARCYTRETDQPAAF